MQQFFLAIIALVAFTGPLTAMPHEGIPSAPPPSEQRAFSALSTIAEGAWVNGDWALKCELSTGRGRKRVVVPLQVIGGFTSQEGRWQRIRFANDKEFLTIGNSQASVWKKKAGEWTPLSSAERLSPVADRIPLNWELYTMSFLGWTEKHYQGVERIRGRWCDSVELIGQAGLCRRAIVWIDSEFNLPVEAELYDADGRLLKDIRAVSVQKVGKEWILKQWEALDVPTDVRVTILATAVAFNQSWPANLYNTSSKDELWPAIVPTAWQVIE